MILATFLIWLVAFSLLTGSRVNECFLKPCPHHFISWYRLGFKRLYVRYKISKIQKKSHLWAIALTFIPPFCIVSFKLSLFQTALNYAAAMLVVVLIFLPVAMVIVTRRKVAQGEWKPEYQTPGGNLSLILLSAVGILIFIFSS